MFKFGSKFIMISGIIIKCLAGINKYPNNIYNFIHWIIDGMTQFAPRCWPCHARSARRYRPDSNESRDVRQDAMESLVFFYGKCCFLYKITLYNIKKLYSLL